MIFVDFNAICGFNTLILVIADDRYSDKFAIAVWMGNFSTIVGVFHSGGLYQLLDPQVSAREMGL